MQRLLFKQQHHSQARSHRAEHLIRPQHDSRVRRTTARGRGTIYRSGLKNLMSREQHTPSVVIGMQSDTSMS